MQLDTIITKCIFFFFFVIYNWYHVRNNFSNILLNVNIGVEGFFFFSIKYFFGFLLQIYFYLHQYKKNYHLKNTKNKFRNIYIFV